MELVKAIKSRYSCRSYNRKPVDKKIVKELLELANLAPSANNGQNRHFIIITKNEDRKWLANMNNQPYLSEAPIDILVTTKLSTETAKEYLESLKNWDMTHNGKNPKEVMVNEKLKNDLTEMKYKWMISDTAAAIENLMLAATDSGLATCWIGILDFEGVRQRFKLPERIIPVCLVTLGYEKTSIKDIKQRKPIDELIHWNKW